MHVPLSLMILFVGTFPKQYRSHVYWSSWPRLCTPSATCWGFLDATVVVLWGAATCGQTLPWSWALMQQQRHLLNHSDLLFLKSSFSLYGSNVHVSCNFCEWVSCLNSSLVHLFSIAKEFIYYSGKIKTVHFLFNSFDISFALFTQRFSFVLNSSRVCYYKCLINWMISLGYPKLAGLETPRTLALHSARSSL